VIGPDRPGARARPVQVRLRRSSEGGGMRTLVFVVRLGTCLVPLVGAMLLVGGFATAVRA
jgi:hypothetical protein